MSTIPRWRARSPASTTTACCSMCCPSRTICRSPVPGLQGFIFKGAKVVLSTDTSPEAVFRLVEKHRVTHIHVVPALLIRWLADPSIARYDLSSLRVIQIGGQRLQPETRVKTKELIPSVTVQENFGMAEGVLMFVRLDDPAGCAARNGRPPDLPRRRDHAARRRRQHRARSARSASSAAAAPTRCAAITARPSTTRAPSRATASTVRAI